jgi:glycosyltransferase involved in cell wall biosynthesis
MIAIAATNPCHLYDLARELFRLGHLQRYYSGYPGWKLKCSPGFPLKAFPLRTVTVYAALKFVPRALRPADRALFRWQDDAFDKAVSRNLETVPFLHAMPGQCRRTFQVARKMGIQTVLNHASGPIGLQRAIIGEEYRRLGLSLKPDMNVDDREDEAEEYALADCHCVASRIVRRQLIEEGVAPEKIWVVPYAADPEIFFPGPGPAEAEYRLIFAGQVTVRKGVHHLLAALESGTPPDWKLDVFGRMQPDFGPLLPSPPDRRITWHRPVSQGRLAEQFRRASVLVLPALEEGFGLVVPQALACGLPCIVSDRVGAADLIRHRVNGSIFPVGNIAALRGELEYWSTRRERVHGQVSWRESARQLAALSGLTAPARGERELS